MSYRYAQCRSIGHSWEPSGLTRDETGAVLNLTCRNCATTRTDRIGTQGSLVRRGYRYISSYDHAAQGRSVWRVDFLAHLAKKREQP